MLRDLLPEPEVLGLLALLIVNHARRATRTDADGRLLRLADQDRAAWDRAAIAEGDRLVLAALDAGPPGRYTLQAAIAALHAEADTYDQTDWAQILVLYDILDITTGRKPRFVQNFMKGAGDNREALRGYVEAVRKGAYPAPEHCF